MRGDLIRGRTIRFTFNDGPMATKTFEHTFDASGTVRYRMVDTATSSGNSSDGKNATKAPDPKYEIATVREDVGAVSYVGSGGYTLTTVLDFKTKKLVAFSSNEKGVSVQHGTFEYEEAAPHRMSAQGHR
jgi:hypothetical protein